MVRREVRKGRRKEKRQEGIEERAIGPWLAGRESESPNLNDLTLDRAFSICRLDARKTTALVDRTHSRSREDDDDKVFFR